MTELKGKESGSGYGFESIVQEDILKLMATDPTMSLAAVQWVKPDYFSGKDQRLLAKLLIGFYQQYSMSATEAQLKTIIGQEVSFGRLSSSYGDTLKEKIEQLYRVPLDGTKRYTMDLVHKFAQQKAWESAILEALPLLKEGRLDEVPDIMNKAVATMVGMDSGACWFFESAEERARRRRDDEETEICPTGILELDLCMRRGGLRTPEIGLWMAPRGRGKSIGLAHVSKRAVVQNWPVAFYSFEMSTDQVADRFDSSFSGVDMWNMKEESKKLLEVMKVYSKRYKKLLMLKQYPTRGRSIADIRGHLETLWQIERWRPKMIVVDYIGIVKPPRLIGEKHLEMQETMEAFRELCGDMGCVGWTAAQINREGARVNVSDGTYAAGSWDQLATADVILTLNQTPEEKQQDLIRFFIDKMRDGKDQLSIGPLGTDWAKMQFVRRKNQSPEEAKRSIELLAKGEESPKREEKSFAKKSFTFTSKKKPI